MIASCPTLVIIHYHAPFINNRAFTVRFLLGVLSDLYSTSHKTHDTEHFLLLDPLDFLLDKTTSGKMVRYFLLTVLESSSQYPQAIHHMLC